MDVITYPCWGPAIFLLISLDNSLAHNRQTIAWTNDNWSLVRSLGINLLKVVKCKCSLFRKYIGKCCLWCYVHSGLNELTHGGWHKMATVFTDETFKRISLNENVKISIEISLKFVSKGPINNIPALVQIMAWRRPGNKQLSETMLVSLLMHICITQPQWVNAMWYISTKQSLVYLPTMGDIQAVLLCVLQDLAV